MERLEEKIQYKDATSCDKMLKSVQRVGTKKKKIHSSGEIKIFLTNYALSFLEIRKDVERRENQSSKGSRGDKLLEQNECGTDDG